MFYRHQVLISPSPDLKLGPTSVLSNYWLVSRQRFRKSGCTIKTREMSKDRYTLKNKHIEATTLINLMISESILTVSLSLSADVGDSGRTSENTGPSSQTPLPQAEGKAAVWQAFCVNLLWLSRWRVRGSPHSCSSPHTPKISDWFSEAQFGGSSVAVPI